MTRVFRTATRRSAIIGAVVLALAGCAGAPAGTGTPVSPSEGTVPTASPTAAPTTSAEPAAACPDSESQGPWGDVIAAEQVTDATGSYCRTTVDPASAASRFDESVVDLDSLATYGFTIDEARAAHRVAVAYVAEQGLDSTRLDDYSSTDAAWFETAKGAFSPSAQARFAPLVDSDGLRDTGLIVTQSLPPLARDGGPRASTTSLGVDKIYATLDLDQVTPLLVVRTPFTTRYSTTDAAIVAAAIRDERGTETLTEDGLRASTPSLFDGADDEGLVLTGGFTVGFGAGDMTAIAFIGAAWTLTTGDDALQIDAVEPETDPSRE